MASKTEIANIALVGLGASTIVNIDDSDLEVARKINVVYESLLKSLLREHPWSFAKKEAALSLVSASPILTDDYTYIYNLPSDFIMLTKTDIQDDYTHKIKGRQLYSDSDAINIEYIYCKDYAPHPSHIYF